jgi:hypothetical protein
VARDGCDELLAVECVELGVGLRRDSRGAWHLAQEGDLTEIVPGAELARDAAVDRYQDASVRDDVELVARLALVEDRLAGGDDPRLEAAGEIPAAAPARGPGP